MALRRPSIVVVSSLFPSAKRPLAGVFIKERMRRVADELNVTIVSPQPWFPGQALLRAARPGYRLVLPAREVVDGLNVVRPRFLALPGMLRQLDGRMMSFAVEREVRHLCSVGRVDLIDAHFLYPDGYAAARVGRRLNLPVTVTLRGTEPGHARQPSLQPLLRRALLSVDRVFGVSDSLRQLAVELGAPPQRTRVIGNGVDLSRFVPVERAEARRQLGLPAAARVLVSVGGLVERKGFHRVIDCLPGLMKRIGGPVHYLIVGGPSPEGDMSAQLRQQVVRLGLQESVHFAGTLSPDQLKLPLSAADVFVLATRNEGWANVFLEAMACGLPVVTTRVGGNAEVVCSDELGIIVPFGDAAALEMGIEQALTRDWDRESIRHYASENAWDKRVALLLAEFDAVLSERAAATPVRGLAPAAE